MACKTIRANLLAAAVLAAITGVVSAADAPKPAAAPAAAPAPAAAAPAAPAGAQQGVVYPGQPVQPVPATAGAGAAKVANPAPPGTPMATLPALPPVGATAPGSAAVGNSAGRAVVDDLVPLGLEDEVRELRRRMDRVLRANAESVGPAAKPVSSSITLTQAPGETPPVLRLAPAMVSNLVFTDSTGQPWPIEYATPGDPSQVDVLLPVPGTATMQVRPKAAYAYGVISVTLKDNPIPISVALTTAQREGDTRLDVRVARRGPNAKAPTIDRPLAASDVDPTMMSVLDGVPPGDAKLLKTSLSGVQAWTVDTKMYVRTPLPVLSPAYFNSMASPDGMRVYLLPAVPSIYVSVDGNIRPVTLVE